MNSPTFSPLYRQIKELMLRSLASGEWSAGNMIPSESELAARFSVSQGTVRKAIDEMAAEHLLIRRQGKGTFVATHDDPCFFFRFLRLQPDSKDQFRESRLPLNCCRRRADKELALLFELPAGAEVIVLKRILTFDDVPVVFDTIYLPALLFPDLTLQVLKDSGRPIYSFFESHYGIRMIRAEEKIRAVTADAESAMLLKVEAGSPLLSVERVAYSYDEKPVEWRKGLYVTDKHHYFNELS